MSDPKKPSSTGNSDESVTARVLRYVKGDKPPPMEHLPPHALTEAGEAAHGEGDDAVHVDERWLIAYADKMTLLAGLFIMLFAMSTIDKTKFEQLKKSSEKSFGKPNVKQELDSVKLAETLNQKEVVEKTLREQIQQLEQQTDSIPQLKSQILKKTEELKKVMKENEETKQKIVQITQQNEQTQREIDSLRSKNPEDLTRKIKELQDKTQQVEKQLVKKEEEVLKLEQQLTQMNSKYKNEGSFIAIVVRWSSEKHDIDLVVKDPKGKTFDFKHRQFGKHPGLFSLDSRTGPGAELWQSSELLPGTYTVTYNFYNTYGNDTPASVEGTIFSKEGSIALPVAQLDVMKNRSMTYKFQVNEDHRVTLLTK